MIRPARKSDEEAIGRMWYELLRSQGEFDGRFAPSEDARERWENDFPAWIDRLSRRIFVADVDGDVRGFISAEQWAPPPIFDDTPGVYIHELFVDPDYRRAGIGTDLVQAVRDWAREIGVNQLRLSILAGNGGAGAFWRAVGGEAIAQMFAVKWDAPETDPDKERAIGFRL